jgi:serine/threonine-protein kinase
VPDANDARLAAMKRAVDLFTVHGPHDPGYVHALVILGGEYIDKDPPQSEQLLTRALSVEVPERERNDSLRGGAYLNLAQTQKSQGKFELALDSYAKADEIFLKTRGENHWAYWEHYAGYAQFVHQRGDRVRAGAMFQRVLGLLPADWKMNTSDTYVRELYAACLSAEGRPEEALPYLETAQRVYQENPSFEYDLRRARLTLADVYATLGRTGDARAGFQFTLGDITKNFPPDHDLVAQVRERWGRFLAAQGDDAGAEAQFREILAQAHDQTTAAVAGAHAGLALLALRRGDAPAALQSSRTAIEVFERATGNNNVRVGPDFWLIHARALLRSGDPAGAKTFAERALDASRQFDAPTALSIASAEVVLADAWLDLGDPEKARVLAAEAKAIHATHRRVPNEYGEPLQALAARLKRA